MNYVSLPYTVTRLLLNNNVFIYSSRNYTVPDPPGLFDGHVWPMYVKHRKIMEDLGVDVGMSIMTKALLKDGFMRVLLNLGYMSWLSARGELKQVDGVFDTTQLHAL